ncbi:MULTISPECIES: hypothetical protein [unclassified Streptomyces]|uniref:hypothetical protein n=1 Tax=unclassified Streptomyces TaxID=2593676 RepID=UPI002035E839
MTTLLVIAEQARPGWVKTWWTAPFTPEGAALVDMPGAVVRTPARCGVSAQDGGVAGAGGGPVARVASEPESQPADHLHVRKGTRP